MIMLCLKQRFGKRESAPRRNISSLKLAQNGKLRAAAYLERDSVGLV
jgi:hypothetical protein